MDRDRGRNSSGPGPQVQASTSTSGGGDQSTTTKKRARKRLPKGERIRKKEEEQLRLIYGPKDSHINMITPQMLKRIKEASDGCSTSTSQQRSMPSSTSASLLQDFPSLGDKGPKMSKSNLTQAMHNQFPWTAKKSPDLRKDFPSLSSVTSTSSTKDSGIASPELRSKSIDLDHEYTDLDENEESLGHGNKGKVSASSAYLQPLSTPTSSKCVPEISSKSALKKKLKNITKKPIVINIDDLIKLSKERASTTSNKTPKEQAKDRKNKQQQMAKKLEHTRKVDIVTPGNILDSSGPQVFHRGKMREIAKEKKPSPLKRAILKSRALRNEIIHQNQKDNFNSNKKLKNKKLVIDKWTNDREEQIAQNDQKPVELPTIKSEVLDECEIKLEPLSPENEKEVLNECEIKLEPLSPEKVDEKIKKLFDISTISSTVEVKNEQADEEPIQVQDAPEDPAETEAKLSLINDVKKSMHSRKFRPYCDMYTSKELFGHIIGLLKELHRFQDKLYHTDPVKFRIKKRYVNGLNNVTTYLDLNKLEMIIIATDIEPNNVKGGLDDMLNYIISTSSEKKVPIIFAGNRFILGKPIKLKVPVSAVGILDKQGAEELFYKVIEVGSSLREVYKNDFEEKLKELEMK